MTNEDYTHFELTAHDEDKRLIKIIPTSWLLIVFLNIYIYKRLSLYMHSSYIFFFPILLIITTIYLFYLLRNMRRKERVLEKRLIVNDEGITLLDEYSKKLNQLKWYQINKVEIGNVIYPSTGYALTVYSHGGDYRFSFSPYYWMSKPEDCVKVLKNCVDVKKKLIIKK